MSLETRLDTWSQRATPKRRPRGFESFFTELGPPVLPDTPEASGPSHEAVAVAASRYGFELLGPPPTLD